MSNALDVEPLDEFIKELVSVCNKYRDVYGWRVDISTMAVFVLEVVEFVLDALCSLDKPTSEVTREELTAAVHATIARYMLREAANRAATSKIRGQC